MAVLALDFGVKMWLKADICPRTRRVLKAEGKLECSGKVSDLTQNRHLNNNKEGVERGERWLGIRRGMKLCLTPANGSRLIAHLTILRSGERSRLNSVDFGVRQEHSKGKGVEQLGK